MGAPLQGLSISLIHTKGAVSVQPSGMSLFLCGKSTWLSLLFFISARRSFKFTVTTHDVTTLDRLN